MTLTKPAAALTSGGQSVTWSGDGSNTLTASAGGITVAVITINDSGDFTVTLSAPFDHADAASEDVLAISVGVEAFDGTSTGTGTLTVNIEDDSPVIATPEQITFAATAGATAQGDSNVSIGADDSSAAMIKVGLSAVSVDGSGHILVSRLDQAGALVTDSNGSSTAYLTVNGEKLTAVQGTDGSLLASDSLGNDIFKVSTDLSTGTYSVEMYATLDKIDSGVELSGSLSGGNSGVYDFGGVTGSFQVKTTATENGVASTVNTSANNIGVGSGQDIATGEVLSVDFIDRSTGSTTVMSSLTFTPAKLGAGETLQWQAYDIAGNVIGSGIVNGVSGGSPSPVTITSDSVGSMFSSVDFSAGAGTSYKLSLQSASGQTERYDQSLELSVTGIDADGDQAAPASVDIIFDSTTVVSADDPVAEDDFIFTRIDTPVDVAVLANDTDPNGDTLSVYGTPTIIAGQGTVVKNLDGTLTVTPDSSFIGRMLIEYTVTDGNGGFDTALVNVSVGAAIGGLGGDDNISIVSGRLYMSSGAYFNDDNSYHILTREDLDGAGLPDATPGGAQVAAFGDIYDTDKGAVLIGGEGYDDLEGGSGDDTLIGGVNGHGSSGNTDVAPGDSMFGGSGADTFLWLDGDDIDLGSNSAPPRDYAIDYVEDFNVNEGDVLHLADLLKGEESGDLTDYLHFDTVANDADFLGQDGVSNTDVVVYIDKDGTGAGDVTQKVILVGVDMASLGNSDADIINNLLAGSNLNVDQ